MIRGGGRARKREYDQDSSYRDRDDFQSKRARGSYSSRGSYSTTSPRGSRGSWYSSSPRGSSSRGSTFRSDSRGSSRPETRGSFRSDSRGSFRSDTRGSYKTSYDSSSSRGSYNSDSRGSYRTSDSRGSYRGSASTRGSYNSDSRGSYRISDSRGSYRGSASSRGDRRRSFGDNLGGSHTKRSTSTGSRGRGSFRSFDRSPSREDFRSPSSDYRRIRKFSGDREDFRGSRSPSFNRNLRDTNSGSRYMEEKYHSKDRRFVGGSGGFRGSFKQRFPRERSSRPPYSRGRGSSQFRGRGRGSFEHRQRQFRKSPSLGRSYHGSDASDEIKTRRGGKYFRRHRRHSDCPESSYFSDDEEDQEDDKDRYPEFETLTEVKPEEENEMKKRDLAGIILRLLMDEGGHMKVHDLEMELITSKNIQFSTSDDFEKFLSDNKEVFKVHTIEVGDMSEVGEKSVTGHSKIMICQQHSKYAGSCKDEKCDALHLCKYRVLSDCTRRACVYGHDVRRNLHNKKVLRDHMLHRLSFPQLQQMFRNLYNRQGINIPRICSFYNSENGCRGEHRNKINFKPCPFLHICKKFIDGTCEQLKNCSRSHSFYDKATFKILERYGLNPDDYSGGKREILRFLKNKCQTSTETESEVHSEHEDISDDEEEDGEYKSWDDENDLEEHVDEEGGDETTYPEDEGEEENEEYDEEHTGEYDEEHTEHENEYHEGDEEHETVDDKKERMEGTAKNDEGVDEGEVVSHDEGEVDKTFDNEHDSSTDKTKDEQSQHLKQKQDTEDSERTQEREVTGDAMETENMEKPAQEGNVDQNVENKGQNKSKTKLQMVKGKKRRVKQTKRVKQPSGSDGAGEKQPSGDDSVPEKQPSGNDSAGEIMKSLAVWQVSYASQEEWKELGDATIQDLEMKYQQYLETKIQKILIGDVEYKVDFSTLEGTTDIENEEDVKLKREIPQ